MSVSSLHVDNVVRSSPDATKAHLLWAVRSLQRILAAAKIKQRVTSPVVDVVHPRQDAAIAEKDLDKSVCQLVSRVKATFVPKWSSYTVKVEEGPKKQQATDGWEDDNDDDDKETNDDETEKRDASSSEETLRECFRNALVIDITLAPTEDGCVIGGAKVVATVNERFTAEAQTLFDSRRTGSSSSTPLTETLTMIDAVPWDDIKEEERLSITLTVELLEEHGSSCRGANAGGAAKTLFSLGSALSGGVSSLGATFASTANQVKGGLKLADGTSASSPTRPSTNSKVFRHEVSSPSPSAPSLREDQDQSEQSPSSPNGDEGRTERSAESNTRTKSESQTQHHHHQDDVVESSSASNNPSSSSRLVLPAEDALELWEPWFKCLALDGDSFPSSWAGFEPEWCLVCAMVAEYVATSSTNGSKAPASSADRKEALLRLAQKTSVASQDRFERDIEFLLHNCPPKILVNPALQSFPQLKAIEEAKKKRNTEGDAEACCSMWLRFLLSMAALRVEPPESNRRGVVGAMKELWNGGEGTSLTTNPTTPSMTLPFSQLLCVPLSLQHISREQLKADSATLHQIIAFCDDYGFDELEEEVRVQQSTLLRTLLRADRNCSMRGEPRFPLLLESNCGGGKNKSTTSVASRNDEESPFQEPSAAAAALREHLQQSLLFGRADHYQHHLTEMKDRWCKERDFAADALGVVQKRKEDLLKLPFHRRRIADAFHKRGTTSSHNPGAAETTNDVSSVERSTTFEKATRFIATMEEVEADLDALTVALSKL